MEPLHWLMALTLDCGATHPYWEAYISWQIFNKLIKLSLDISNAYTNLCCWLKYFRQNPVWRSGGRVNKYIIQACPIAWKTVLGWPNLRSIEHLKFCPHAATAFHLAPNKVDRAALQTIIGHDHHKYVRCAPDAKKMRATITTLWMRALLCGFIWIINQISALCKKEVGARQR